MKRFLVIFSSVLILSMFLAACSGGGANNGGTPNAPATDLSAPGAYPPDESTTNSQGGIPDTGQIQDPDQLRMNSTSSPESGADSNDGDDGKDGDDRTDDQGQDDDPDQDPLDTGQVNLNEENVAPVSFLSEATVLNRGRQTIAAVDGWLLDPAGQIAYVILDPDEDKQELEIEGDRLAVPWRVLVLEKAIRPDQKADREWDDDRPVLVFDQDESLLKDAPSFSEDDFADEQAGEMQGYWGAEVENIPVTGDSLIPMKFDTLEEIDVVSRDGDEIGQVSDLLVDRDTGQVRYAVIHAASILESDGWILVPDDVLSWTAGDENEDPGLIINATLEELRAAPYMQDDQGWADDLK